jgi:hypothetical protein
MSVGAASESPGGNLLDGLEAVYRSSSLHRAMLDCLLGIHTYSVYI